MKIRLLYTVIVICSLVLSGSPAASAQEREQPQSPQVVTGLPGTVYRYEQTFGETGVAYLADNDHLYGPHAAALDNEGNLWITEGTGARAMKYAPDGTFLTSIGTAGMSYLADETHFVQPGGVVVDSQDNVWVVDTISARAVKFDASGNYMSQLGITWEGGSDNAHFDLPIGIAVDSADNIYVSDLNNHRIQVFESNGYYSTTIGLTGNPGPGDDQFSSPYLITIDDNDYLYVADNQNHRVQIFDETHTLVSTLGITGECGGWGDNDRLCEPRGIAVGNGYIYVTESGNHRVQIFDSTTYSYTATLGIGGGSGDYQFNWPTGITVDSAGNIYVVDLLNHRVQKFDASLTLVDTYGVTNEPYLTDGYHFNQPFDVAVSSTGDIAVVEAWGRGHRLVVLDAAGVPLFTVGEPGVAGDDNEHFGEPDGVEFDAEGNIYVADCANHRVQIFDTNGMWVARIGTGWGEGNYEFKCPSGVAVDNVGNIYVADSDNHRIQIFDSSRVYSDTLGVTGVPGSDIDHFYWPQDVEVDSDGNIYTAEWYNHRVQKFDSNGNWQMTLGVTGECGYDFDHFCEPYGVAVDAAGNIYVAEKFNYRVQVFDASGAYLTTIAGTNSDQTGGLRESYGVDVDASGNVYVPDMLNHRVQKFTPGVPGWDQINVNGFGLRNNSGVYAQEVFNGKLYAGAANWEVGGRVWRTADGVIWEPASAIGFGWGTANLAILDMIEFDGQLYASTGWSGGTGQLWRTADGTTWEAITTDGFGDGGNFALTTFGIFNDRLYIGTANNNGTQIWRSKSGDNGKWVQVVPDSPELFGNLVTGLAVFEGAFYAAVESQPAQIWRSTNGSDWVPVVTDGFGYENNVTAGGFAEFDGYLYHANGNEIDGAQVFRSDDGITWELAMGGGFGDMNNTKVEAVYALDGWLYAAMNNEVTGVELWRTDDGAQWEQVGLDGFGDSNNFTTLWSNAVTTFECRLTIGVANDANGAEIWSMQRDRALCVDKLGPASAFYGDEVSYQFLATYSSLDATPAQLVNVTDDYYSGILYLSGDKDGDGYLDTGETWLFEITTTIGDPGEIYADPLVNVATLTGQDYDGTALAAATDAHTTDILMQLYIPMVVR
jgi:sugar lactone lactonase YvrE